MATMTISDAAYIMDVFAEALAELSNTLSRDSSDFRKYQRPIFQEMTHILNGSSVRR
jgi:hypothetical protein